jgi:hypothetical protein
MLTRRRMLLLQMLLPERSRARWINPTHSCSRSGRGELGALTAKSVEWGAIVTPRF